MADYVAGLCHWGNGALAPPFETVNITADDDDDAVLQAIEWRLARTLTTMAIRATWLQVGDQSCTDAYRRVSRLRLDIALR